MKINKERQNRIKRRRLWIKTRSKIFFLKLCVDAKS